MSPESDQTQAPRPLTRVLVTGATGFLGRHVCAALIDQGISVHGLHRSASRPVTSGRSADISWHGVTLVDTEAVLTLLDRIRPEGIIHCAGIVGHPPGGLSALLDANLLPTASLLDALEKLETRCPLVLVSSAAVYGRPACLPVDENAPLAPVNSYGVSKAAQELLGQSAFLGRDLPVICARPFNLLGSGLSTSLFASDFSRQIAAAELAGHGQLHVGNLAAGRDFIDVQDAAAGLIALLKQGTPGEAYNLCRGEPATIGECTEHLLSLARVPITIEQQSGRFRQSEIDMHFGNPQRIQAQTGWKVTVPLTDSLASTLEYWRTTLRDTAFTGESKT